MVNVQIKYQNWGKCHFKDFDHGTAVDATWTGLSISETVDHQGISHTTVSRVFSDWGKNNGTKHPVSSNSVVRGEWPD